MQVFGDYMVYINKCSKVLALIPMHLASHRARQKQGEWYDSAVTLRSIRQLRDLIGDMNLARIGREIIPLVSRIESEVLTDLRVNSPETGIEALPKFYARYHNGCGGLEVQKVEDRKYRIEDDTPYPESLNAGLIEGTVREFGGLHVEIVSVRVTDDKRRYTVTWS